MQKKKVLLPIIAALMLLSGCSTENQRTDSLYDIINDINCTRYEFTVDEYEDYDSIAVNVFYDEAYSKDKINDLLIIKKEIEKYINENISLYSSDKIGITCYSLSDMDKEGRIPISYISFVNNEAFSDKAENKLDHMEINSECFSEQFENISLSDIDTLKISSEFTFSDHSFDNSILACFTELSELRISSAYSVSEDEIKTLLPEGCTVEYTE